MRGNTLGFNATLPIAEALETHPSLKVYIFCRRFIFVFFYLRELCGVICLLEG